MLLPIFNPTIPPIITLEPPKPPAIVLTWEDNPQKCNEDVEWIASESPYYCIPKQKLQKVRQPTGVRPTNYSIGNDYDYKSCTWWVKYNRPDIPNTWGDATNWLYNARADGYATGTVPKAGAVGWAYGHVVYVFSVQGDTITIGDGNYDWQGSYRIRTAQASEFPYYIY